MIKAVMNPKIRTRKNPATVLDSLRAPLTLVALLFGQALHAADAERPVCTPVSVSEGPLLFFVHPEDAEGNSHPGGGGVRREVCYLYDPSLHRTPQILCRDGNFDPIVRLDLNRVLINSHREFSSLVLDMKSGAVSPLLSTGHQTEFVEFRDGKLFFQQRTIPFQIEGYQLKTNAESITHTTDYHRPHNYLHVAGIQSVLESKRLADVAVERVLSIEPDGFWVITAGENRKLCRISREGAVEEILKLDHHLVAPEARLVFSPGRTHLALTYLYDRHDFHRERELKVIHLPSKTVAFSQSRVKVGSLDSCCSTSLSIQWLDETKFFFCGEYWAVNVINLEGETTPEMTSNAIEFLNSLQPGPGPTRTRNGCFDQEFGLIYFREDSNPAGSVLDERGVKVNDLEVSARGKWAAFTSPDDYNTYVIDGEERRKKRLLPGWSYGFAWLPSIE